MRDVVQPWHGVQPSVVLAVVAEVGDALAMRHHGAVAAVDQHLKQGRSDYGKMSKKSQCVSDIIHITMSYKYM